MIRHHYSKTPGAYRRPTKAGVRRSEKQARILPGQQSYAQRRIDGWDRGTAQFDAELALHRSCPHPFHALRGCDYCLDCGATVDEHQEVA